MEWAGFRHGDGKLAEAEHDQIHNHRADSVGDDRAQWARLVVMV